jgi:hypothetical protein
MSRRQKDPLRALTTEERTTLERVSRAQSAPAVQVTRAKLLLAVADGLSYTAAAQSVGRRSNDAISHLVTRFNQAGLAALELRHSERAVRRARQRVRRHALGGSGAVARRPIRRRRTSNDKWRWV